MESLQLSIIIAVYKRQDELTELLNSLSLQSDSDFEVVIVDDGSPEPLESLVNTFTDRLTIQYHYKSNSGPAPSRNYGMSKAKGNYFIFLDSDTLVPENYIEIVRRELTQNYVDAFGGPDDADESFTDLQKAISFSMTSLLTTGGIRGGKRHIGKFQPRSFNMGLSRKAFEKTAGFGKLRIGEDPDLSMTLWENGFETRLFPMAKVYHKRRTSLTKFAKQVREFGIARPILNQRHPEYTKLTFWFPSLFSIGLIVSVFLLLINLFIQCEFLFVPLFFYGIYSLVLFVSASAQFKSIKIGFLSFLTTYIQFFNYGWGFLRSWICLHILNKKARDCFPNHFIQNK